MLTVSSGSGGVRRGALGLAQRERTDTIMRTRAVLSLVLVALATTAGAQEHTLDFIWEEAPFPRAHASTIVEAPDGTLIAAWFGGSGEGQKDVGVWSSRKPRGEDWSPPVQLYKEPGL